MTNTKNLTDEQLENVTGGGNGIVPPGGITFTLHNGNFFSHRYYSKEPNLNPGNVIYLYNDYYLSRFMAKEEDIVVTGNTWIVINTGRVFDVHEFAAYSECAAKYPYVLNIVPEADDPDQG